MARSRETKIELTAYDDLFQTDESREEEKLSKIRDIPISEIDEFPDHPFKVLMDEDMEQLVESMQNYLFADSIATAFKNSDYDITVVRAESPRDTIELCRVFKPFVLLMEVTAYTPWLLCERMKLRDEVKTVCPDCKIALIVDSNTEKQAAKDIRDAKKNGIIDQFFYGSMTAEYLMDQIYAM